MLHSFFPCSLPAHPYTLKPFELRNMSSKTSINKQVRAAEPVQDAPPPSCERHVCHRPATIMIVYLHLSQNTDQASTSQTSSHPNSNPSPSAHRPQPFLHPSPSGNIVIYNYEGWTPPANDGVARARARRRFFVALAWGFLIWIVLGSVAIGLQRIRILELTRQTL